MTRKSERKERKIRLATIDGFITVQQLADMCGFSRTTVYRYLADLVEAGKLVKEGKGTVTYYKAPDAKQHNGDTHVAAH